MHHFNAVRCSRVTLPTPLIPLPIIAEQGRRSPQYLLEVCDTGPALDSNVIVLGTALDCLCMQVIDYPGIDSRGEIGRAHV